MSKNKRITAKEIKQGVTAYAVTVGEIEAITFTGKAYYEATPLLPGWKFNYVTGVGRAKPSAELSSQPWDRYLADAGIVVPGRRHPMWNPDYECNCVFRTLKAAQKFVKDSKKAVERHKRFLNENDPRECYLYDDDDFDR